MVITKDQSLQLKGIALTLLLLHHLFGCKVAEYNDYFNVFHILGNIGKSCVSLFVLLSGYGLAISYKKKIKLKEYILKRFTKLYLNYWLIWVLFVPAGVLFFDRPFDYGAEHTILYFFADFFGIINCFGKFGYCDTWWFYSCIILLYLLFPLLRRLYFYSNKAFYTLCLMVLLISIFFRWSMGGVNPIRYYLFPFMVGMTLPNIAIDKLNVSQSTLFKLSFVCLVICCLLRISRFYSLCLDSFIAISFILIWQTKPIWANNRKLNNSLIALGNHSFNIFLFHTFIFELYFKNFIYYSKSPIIIFCLTISVCLVLSTAIEKLKQVISFNTIQTKISKYYD